MFNSAYYASSEQPEWVRLWNAYELDDDVLIATKDAVLLQLKPHGYQKIGELLLVVSTLLMLVEAGLHDQTEDDVVQLGIANLTAMKASGALREEREKSDRYTRESGYAGMGFHNLEGKHFADLKAKIAEMASDAVVEAYPTEAGELLQLMSLDTQAFAEELIHSNHKIDRYSRVPILSYMPEKEFVYTVVGLGSSGKRQVQRAFQGRYHNAFQCRYLGEEGVWLLTIADLLQQEKSKLGGKMSGLLIGLIEQNARIGAANIETSLLSPDR